MYRDCAANARRPQILSLHHGVLVARVQPGPRSVPSCSSARAIAIAGTQATQLHGGAAQDLAAGLPSDGNGAPVGARPGRAHGLVAARPVQRMALPWRKCERHGVDQEDATPTACWSRRLGRGRDEPRVRQPRMGCSLPALIARAMPSVADGQCDCDRRAAGSKVLRSYPSLSVSWPRSRGSTEHRC